MYLFTAKAHRLIRHSHLLNTAFFSNLAEMSRIIKFTSSQQ